MIFVHKNKANAKIRNFAHKPTGNKQQKDKAAVHKSHTFMNRRTFLFDSKLFVKACYY